MDDVCGLPSGGSVRIAARALPPEGAPATLPARVVATEPAAQLIRELVERHGPVMFHQSGGCCDGSAPMCYPVGEFHIGMRDVLVGDLPVGDARIAVWISGSQFEAWKHTQLVLDAVPGRGSGFSLETPTGRRFLSRARVFTTDEIKALEDVPVVLGIDRD
ncbi:MULTISPECIES: DUF779 domain-containing protein [Dietzia]|uniref:DUF779 domain-containing protein n=1 Tax=Dietzia TaxID=37914 RepID=UPI000E891CBE|nr:DUF779 domain-containing protein [Dietzia cinnamea]MCT2299811.1 DUF779 domain-containing protein [Dietzia cinnamea]HBD21855.1 DUF779 domain-containing protein [Dietzia sp.]